MVTRWPILDGLRFLKSVMFAEGLPDLELPPPACMSYSRYTARAAASSRMEHRLPKKDFVGGSLRKEGASEYMAHFSARSRRE